MTNKPTTETKEAENQTYKGYKLEYLNGWMTIFKNHAIKKMYDGGYKETTGWCIDWIDREIANKELMDVLYLKITNA